MKYGRARLWLGISGVGLMVTLATVALVFQVPDRVAARFAPGALGQLQLLLSFVGLYAAVHIPLDIFGGYVLPRWYGRSCPSGLIFAGRLLRGVAVHSLMLLLVGTALWTAGNQGGVVATILTGVALSLALLLGRPWMARGLAAIRPVAVVGMNGTPDSEATPTRYIACDDEGFTGGVVGVLSARQSWVPERWATELGPEGLDVARQRRRLAIESGSWAKGRLAAVLFTWIGLALSALWVGSESLGTAAGVVGLSLIFTLWSFLGLLVLPTLSRSSTARLDALLREAGVDEALIHQNTRGLDRLQDDEPDRPRLVEVIFHPIPSVNSRIEGGKPRGFGDCWDVARSAVYLSASGMGLLGRAVHCNCGRPALWAFLPTD